jgi:hypothetical protein
MRVDGRPAWFQGPGEALAAGIGRFCVLSDRPFVNLLTGDNGCPLCAKHLPINAFKRCGLAERFLDLAFSFYELDPMDSTKLF